jgi:hypothetical protein
MMEQQHLQTYLELFCHRRDLYALQTKRGSYFLTRSEVTQQVAASHLRGSLTAGFYALAPDNTVRWVVLDADKPDGLEQLQDAWRHLGSREISAFLELSRRGGHLWTFFEPGVPAEQARRLILGALPLLEDIEVFPKHDELTEGRPVGTLVRGPFGIHRLTGKRYPFVDPISLKPLSGSVRGVLELLQDAERISPDRVSAQLETVQDQADAPSPREMSARSIGRSRRSPLEQLKERIGDPYSFISQFVELDASGKGHCPFHTSPREWGSPSFLVNQGRRQLRRARENRDLGQSSLVGRQKRSIWGVPCRAVVGAARRVRRCRWRSPKMRESPKVVARLVAPAPPLDSALDGARAALYR